MGKDGERDRVLSEAELIELFKKLPASGLHEIAQYALLIQLSTIARIGEILGARWAQVDFERRQWVLPETKNGKAHTVHLSDFSMVQFEALHKITGETAWLVPNAAMNGPIDSKAVTKQTADRQRGNATPLRGRTQQTDSLALTSGQWRPHDLRRTGATMMAELGGLPDVIERCLNHKQPEKMKRIYQHAQYGGPMRDCWDLLGARLDLLQKRAQGFAENIRSLQKMA